jgi:hypothetical protein
MSNSEGSNSFGGGLGANPNLPVNRYGFIKRFTLHVLQDMDFTAERVMHDGLVSKFLGRITATRNDLFQIVFLA